MPLSPATHVNRDITHVIWVAAHVNRNTTHVKKFATHVKWEITMPLSDATHDKTGTATGIYGRNRLKSSKLA